MKNLNRFILRYIPLFLAGWWLSAMFFTKAIGMADGWVTLGGLALIWIAGTVEEIE